MVLVESLYVGLYSLDFHVADTVRKALALYVDKLAYGKATFADFGEITIADDMKRQGENC